MKNVSSLVLTSVVAAFLVVASAPTVSAQSTKQCVCHNILNNPVEVCSDDDSFKVGHEMHIERGSDVLGACPVEASPTPTVKPTGTVTATPSPTAKPTVPVTPSPTGPIPTVTPTDEYPPIVPEFGLVSGISTLIASAGSYLMLKKRV